MPLDPNELHEDDLRFYLAGADPTEGELDRWTEHVTQSDRRPQPDTLTGMAGR